MGGMSISLLLGQQMCRLSLRGLSFSTYATFHAIWTLSPPFSMSYALEMYKRLKPPPPSQLGAYVINQGRLMTNTPEGVERGGAPCRMSILRNGNVALSNLRSLHIALSIIGNFHVPCHCLNPLSHVTKA